MRRILVQADPGAHLTPVANAPVALLGSSARELSLFAVSPSPEESGPALAGRLRDLLPHDSSIALVGSAVLENRFSHLAATEVTAAERIALPLAFATALIAFSSAVAATLPFLIGVVTLLIVNAILALLTSVLSIDPFATTITSVLTLGLSIDFSLFMVTRYRGELAKGDSPLVALRASATAVGSAISISSAAIAGTLLCLTVVGLSTFTSMAVGGAVAVFATALTAIVLLPALMTLLADHLDRLALPSRNLLGGTRSWSWLAGRVTSRPLLALSAVSAALLLLCLPALGLRWSAPSAADLPRHDPAREDLVRLDHLLGPGATGPIEVVTKEDPEKIRSALLATPAIATVLLPVRGEDGWSLIRAISVYRPGAHESERLVRQLRQNLAGRRATFVGGLSAASVDLNDRLETAVGRMLAAMIAIAIIALAIGLRSLLVPLKAVVGTLFSVGATLGALAAIEGLKSPGHPEMSLIVPLCLTAVLFGLSIDYEVFLLSRIREETRRGDGIRASVQRGMIASARPIVLAALTLASVFAVLSTSSLRVFHQFGLGVVIGVIIDATLVRCVFIPAATVLLGRWNWWLPGRPLPDREMREQAAPDHDFGRV
jgi:RND superfamily putative drug exporter